MKKLSLLLVGVCALSVRAAQPSAPPPGPLTIPEAAEVAKVISRLKERTFDREYERAAANPTAAKALAGLLLNEASERKYSATIYAHLSEARRLAAEHGDVALAAQAVAQLAARFRLDAAAHTRLLLETLTTLRKDDARAPKDSAQMVVLALQAARRMLDLEEYAQAATCAKIALEEAARTKEADLTYAAESMLTTTTALEKAKAKLLSNADDPKANSVYGKYWTLQREHWQRGLQHLAKGGDARLREAARLDLEQPAPGLPREEAAERWYKLGREAKGSEKQSLWLRAWSWYNLALFDAVGDDDQTPRRRIEEIEGEYSQALQHVAKNPEEIAWLGDFRSWFPEDISSRQPVYPSYGGRMGMERVFEQTRRGTLSADGRYALTLGNDDSLRLWDLRAGSLLRTLDGPGRGASSIVFSKDANLALTAGSDKVLRLWDLHTGKLVQTLAGHDDAVSSVALSPDGKTALSGSFDKTVRLWELRTGKDLGKLEGQTGQVYCVAFSRDGGYALAGGEDKTIRVWSLHTGKLVRTLEGHTDYVKRLAVSDDGQYAISGGFDNTVRVWRLPMSVLRPLTR